MKGFSSGLNKATDNTYLHVVADVKMSGGRKPEQVFLSIRCEEASKHMGWFNQLATYDDAKQRFVATVSFSALPDTVNCMYDVQLTALDPSAVFDRSSEIAWQLGKIDVSYREGVSASTFVRKTESTKYFPKEQIIAQFPPKANENKNPIIALAVAATVIFAFLVYVKRQFSHCHANFARLDFWGVMLVVSLPSLTDIAKHLRAAQYCACVLVRP